MCVQAQNVGIGTNSPDASAVLDASASNKGLLMPRLTTAQRKAIAGESLDYFGCYSSISGNYAIIGASRYSGSGLANMGLAYIFNKTSSGWKQVARLAARDSAVGDFFGGSVCISGNYAIVGSPTKKINANTSQGASYVYQRTGTTWILDTILRKPSGQAYDDFGWSVGVCAFNTGGPGIAVGIPYADGPGTDKGEVYFYKKTGTVWTFIQNIVPTDLQTSDYYGSTVAMDSLSGNKLAVGAPWATVYSNTSAAVNIYTRTGSTWANTSALYVYNFEIIPNAGQLQPLSGSISIGNITFGISLSLSGNTLLIGASGGLDYPNGGSTYYTDRVGEVYIFNNYSGNSYTRTNILKSDFPVTGDLYGQTVGISGGNYVTGSSHAFINGLVNAGAVYFGTQ